MIYSTLSWPAANTSTICEVRVQPFFDYFRLNVVLIWKMRKSTVQKKCLMKTPTTAQWQAVVRKENPSIFTPAGGCG
jgi:hypothetical protein